MHITQMDFLLAAFMAPLALQLFIGLSGFGAFTLAATSESQAESQKKVFFSKFAKQISSMGVFLVVYVVLAVAGSAVFLTMRHAAAFALWVENPMLSAPLAITLAATAALCLAYRAMWDKLKNNKSLRKFLGITAVAGSWAVFFVSLAMKLFALKTPPDITWPAAPSQVLGMARFACFWPLLLQAILLSMACAGALGLLYLLLRREKDDFGRDYYNFAVKYCAKWALFPSLAQIPAQAWFLYTLWEPITNVGNKDPILMFSGAGLVFIMGACALWTGVIRAGNPLRQKPLIFAGALCLWAALTGITAADVYIFL